MISWDKIRKCFASLFFRPSEEVKPTPAAEFPLEEIRKFLPTFLSQGSETAFLDEIRHFLKSENYHPFYTQALHDKPYLFQGDGLEGLLVIKLPDTAIALAKGLILSNSCDVSPENDRLFDASLCYAPIFSFPTYLESLRKKFEKDRVDVHEQAIRRQAITQIFFLPQGGKLDNDAIVFLDRIISVANDTLEREALADRRLFSLSDFGAWLLTLKLSIHLCRIRDKVDRVAGVVA